MLLIFAFCKQPGASPGAIAASSASRAAPSGTKSPDAPASRTPSVVVAHGTLEGARFDFALERRGDEAIAIWAPRGGRATTLTGLATSGDGGIAFDVGDGVHVAGRIAGDAVRSLSVRTADRKAPVAATLELSAAAADFEQSYAGALGESHVRMKLARRGDALTGAYRAGSSIDDVPLAGRASGDRFELGEPSGARFTGVLVGEGGVLGRWASIDGESSDVALVAATAYPESYALKSGPGRVAARETWAALAPSCVVSRTVPALVGTGDPAVESALEAGFERQSRAFAAPLTKADCAGATDAVPYEQAETFTVTGERPGFVGVELSLYEFTGGAHGTYAARCVVADLARRDVVRLSAGLTPRGRATIGRLALLALERENHVTKLTKAGFFEDAPQLDDAELCFATSAGKTSLRVVFPLYSIAPYVMGMPSAELDASDVGGVFRAGTTGAALFP